MTKKILTSLIAAGCSLALFGQGAVDAYTAAQSQIRGTARYMSMGGAFGALGGDLSTLNQNPAGLGVYRHSEIGATLNVDFQNSALAGSNQSMTRAACNNFGYAGAMNLGNSGLVYFNWGATYNRVNSFERRYNGSFNPIGNSLSNYIASFSSPYTVSQLEGSDSSHDYYDPYWDSNVPWLSALAYNSYVMNPYGNDGYTGLWNSASSGNATADVVEKGFVDEYSINFGGNISNVVFWGIAFGITDLSFTRTSYWEEKIWDATVPDASDNALTTGGAIWGLENRQTVSGTGFNVKLGVIVKPINELRLGLAVHTPTWYKLNYSAAAWSDYGVGQVMDDGYYTFDSFVDDNPFTATGTDYWSVNFRTPWRLMVSAATVLGSKFILSADYVYESYRDMSYSDNLGQITDLNNDIKQYYRPSSQLRLGAEFRVTPKFSLRAGYALRTAGVTQTAHDAGEAIYTAGTQPMFTMDGNTNNISVGLGYRTGGFYIDAAYVYSRRNSNWFAYSSYPSIDGYGYQLEPNPGTAPSATLTDTHNNLVLSIGFKF